MILLQFHFCVHSVMILNEIMFHFISVLPLEARIILPKPILIAGEEHEILCETKGSRPQAITTWWLESQKIGLALPEGLLEASNNTLSTLHFTPKPSDDGKHLTCKSVNPALPKTMVEDEITLKVQCKYIFLFSNKLNALFIDGIIFIFIKLLVTFLSLKHAYWFKPIRLFSYFLFMKNRNEFQTVLLQW